MSARQPLDLALAHVVSAERFQRAAQQRRAREARPARRSGRQAAPLRPVGRLLVRLGVALGGGPETPARTRSLSSVRPR